MAAPPPPNSIPPTALINLLTSDHTHIGRHKGAIILLVYKEHHHTLINQDMSFLVLLTMGVSCTNRCEVNFFGAFCLVILDNA